MPIESVGGDFVVNAATSGSPGLAALADGRFVAAYWSEDDVHARVFSQSGNPLDAGFVVNETPVAYFAFPEVLPLPDGRFVVTWASSSIVDGPPESIHGRIFESDGSPASSDFVVNTTIGDRQEHPSITAMSDGRFIAMWNSDDAGDGDGNSIRARIFNTDGSAAGDDFVVNSTGVNNQYAPVATTLADGRFVAAWFSYDSGDGDSQCIRARIFNEDGSAAAPDFVVNTIGNGGQLSPEIASLSGDRFIITWYSSDAGDGDGSCVRGRIFNADGSTSGDDILLNSTTASNQDSAVVTVLADGRFVATWRSFDTPGDGDGTCIRARLFNEDGTAAGDDFVVNAGGAGFQFEPSVAAMDDGRFVISWIDGGASSSLKARIFDPTSFQGTADADIWQGGNLADHIYGGAGEDVLSGGAGDDVTSGDAGNDELFGGAGNDSLFGGAGDDHLVGGAGADRLVGGAGFDTADYSTSVDRVGVYLDEGWALGGDAHRDVLSGIEKLIGTRSLNADFLTGDAGANEISGLEGDDRINGMGGDDLLSGGAGADMIDGGAGFDYVDYSASVSSVHVDLAANIAQGGDADGDVLTNVEAIYGSPEGDVLTGDNGSNEIFGMGGTDRIKGGGGDDRLYSTDSSVWDMAGDRIDGGSGNDIIFGGDGSDVLVGGDGDDTLYGIHVSGSYNGDWFDSGAGDDGIFGTAGDDIMIGGAGADVLDGVGLIDLGKFLGGIDTADYSTSAARVGVYLNTGLGYGGDAQGDHLYSIENLIGTKSSLGDYLTGDANDNVIAGLAGPDQINGMGGVDTADYSASTARVGVYLNTGVGFGGDAQGDVLANIESLIGTKSSLGDYLTGDANDNVIIGLAGPDQINGMGGVDTADYSASTARVGVYLNTGTGFGGDAQGDVLANIENVIGTWASAGDFLTGDANDNRLEGLGGSDTLNGGAGNDSLSGGSGADILTGGSGSDLFVFNGSPDLDRITDFENDIDKILVQYSGPLMESGDSDGDAYFVFDSGMTIVVENISSLEVLDDMTIA